MIRLLLPVLLPLLIFVPAACLFAGEWQVGKGKLMTRWAADVTPENVHPEYPRPQLVRSEWLNLNGLWQYAILPTSKTGMPDSFEGEILVPFPAESALSGVMREVGPENRLWYRRTFSIPEDWAGRKIQLNFGDGIIHKTPTFYLRNVFNLNKENQVLLIGRVDRMRHEVS